MNPHDLDKEQRARLERLFEEYKPGERVRAVCTIVDGASGTEIAEGTIGVVRQAGAFGCSPLFAVDWDPAGRLVERIITSAEHLEPVDRPLQGLSLQGDCVVVPGTGTPPALLPVDYALETRRRALDDVQRKRPALAMSPAAPERRFDAGAFVTLCRFDLLDIRAELVKLEAAWRACVDDLEGVGVLRPGHVPPEGVANVEACMPGLRASIHLLDVMIAKLGPAVGSGEPGT